MSRLRIAALQTGGTPGDAEENLAELDDAARRAAERGVELLLTPELFVTGYDIGERARRWSEQPLAARVGEVCRRRGIGVLAGIPEPVEGGIGNCATLVDERGDVLARHVKAHLFGELDRDRFVPGGRLVTTVDFRGVRIALLICYDVEFPEAARAAAVAGAHLIAVPTAQMTPFAFVADTVVPARAWENQVYLAYANHVGQEAATVYIGRSCVVDPGGAVLARAEQEAALLVADVDTEAVAAAQRRNPYLLDRRTDLYSPPRSEGSSDEL